MNLTFCFGVLWLIARVISETESTAYLKIRLDKKPLRGVERSTIKLGREVTNGAFPLPQTIIPKQLEK